MRESLREGQRVGPYELGRLVARGGMAEIWLARSHGTHGVSKTVVVKRILAARSDDGRFKRMFVGEARVAMGFDHGNIAQVFDFFEEKGEYFLVMEFVDGRSLYDLLRLARRKHLRFPWPQAAYVMRETAQGLHHAHTRTGEDGAPLNVVHRDVSPQNVLVGFDGQVKLVDFGIARARTVASETRAGVAKGKYLYFSPEQARGHEVDRRTDVYACGVVLYQLVTGRLPVELDVPYAEALARIVHGSWPTPRELVPDLSESLEAIILGAMANDAEDRFQSAHDLEVALGSWLHAEAPGTGSDAVAVLARWLAADALTEEGRPPELPADRLRSLTSWQLPEEDEAGSGKGRTRPLGPRGAMAALAGGGIVVLAAGMLILSGGTEDMPSEVPPPAPLGTRAEPSQPGASARSETAETTLAPPARPERPPATPTRFKEGADGVLEARLPLASITVGVDTLPGDAVALDPLSHYTVRVTGQGVLTGFIERTFSRIFFHAHGPETERSGVLRPDRPLRLSGMSAVSFFAWDSGDATSNRGSFIVEVRAGQKRHAHVTIDANRQVISGSEHRLTRLAGLDPYRRYDATLVLEDGVDPGPLLFMHTYEVGPLIAAGGVVDDAMGVITADETVEIHAANDIVIFRLAAVPEPTPATVRLVLHDRREPDR